MNIQIKSTDGSLKLCMSMRYLSIDDREWGGNCCNGKVSLASLLTKWDFKLRKHRRERAPGLCLLFPPIQENPIVNSSRKKDALGGPANTHSFSCQLAYSTAERAALPSSQTLSSASHFSFATYSLIWDLPLIYSTIQPWRELSLLHILGNRD